MSERTARKFERDPKLPSQRKVPRHWRTRLDPLAGLWDEVIVPLLEANPGLRAVTIFEELQDSCGAERVPDAVRRTLERRVRSWRARHGPDQEVFFPRSIRRAGWGCRISPTPASSVSRSPASGKSDNPIRPGGCSWGKNTSWSGPCRARQLRTRRSRVRRTASGTRSAPQLSCSSSKIVTARRPGLASSSGTTTSSHSPARGSRRVRQSRGTLRCDGSFGSRSNLRAVRSLMPALAAAMAWGCC